MKNRAPVAEAIRAEIAEHEDMIRRLKAALSALDGQKTKGPAAKSPKKPAPRKRKMSAASRKRMADGAKARWAKLRAEKAKAGE